MLPLIGRSLVQDPRLEWVFLLSSISIGLITLLTGFLRHHGKAYPAIGFIAGISIICLTRIFLEESRALEIAGLAMGAILVTRSHLLNLRLCRGCKSCGN
jgi:MerC mercury resistance protein